jgi:hypothetical protein
MIIARYRDQPVRVLSKSKLLSFRQCPKRLWLEVHGRHLMGTAGADTAFTAGRSVGEVARELYDPAGLGQLVDVGVLGVEAAIERTRELLASGQPVFEAGFAAEGASAFADVLLPVTRGWTLKLAHGGGEVVVRRSRTITGMMRPFRPMWCGRRVCRWSRSRWQP